MASLNELAFSLRNVIRGGKLSDDEPISLRHAKFLIGNYRALVIKRDLDKGKSLDEEVIQDLGCVPVELVDKGECCSTVTGCYVLRTITSIPTPIDRNFDSGIVSVGKINGADQFQRSTFETIRWSQYEKYTSKLSRYYEKSGHIYVTQDCKLDFVRIRGIFEDPRQAKDYVTCSNETCYNDDMEYPVSSWMITVINEMILKKEFRIEMNAPTDDTNDAGSARQQQVQQQ